MTCSNKVRRGASVLIHGYSYRYIHEIYHIIVYGILFNLRAIEEQDMNPEMIKSGAKDVRSQYTRKTEIK